MTTLLRYALGVPFIRDALQRESVTLPGGRTFTSTDDLLAELGAARRRQDRAHARRRLVGDGGRDVGTVRPSTARCSGATRAASATTHCASS